MRPNTRNNYQFVVNILKKEDFSGSFQLAGVVVNDNVYCKYYEAVYIRRWAPF